MALWVKLLVRNYIIQRWKFRSLTVCHPMFFKDPSHQFLTVSLIKSHDDTISRDFISPLLKPPQFSCLYVPTLIDITIPRGIHAHHIYNLIHRVIYVIERGRYAHSGKLSRILATDLAPLKARNVAIGGI